MILPMLLKQHAPHNASSLRHLLTPRLLLISPLLCGLSCGTPHRSASLSLGSDPILYRNMTISSLPLQEQQRLAIEVGQQFIAKSNVALNDVTAPDPGRMEVNSIASIMGINPESANLALSLTYAHLRDTNYSSATITITDTEKKEFVKYSFDFNGKLIYWIDARQAASLKRKHGNHLLQSK